MADRKLLLVVLLATVLPAVADAASLAEDIMARMAALPSRSTNFVEEKRLTSLIAPLISCGRLVFTPAAGPSAARLEQDTEAPKPERVVIDGDQLTIAQSDGAPRTLSLDDYPALRTLADTLRAALAGDLATLRRLYAIEEQGTMQAWRLMMVPRDAALRRVLARVTLDGSGAELRQIDIQSDGDEQRLTIQRVGQCAR